MPATSTSSGSSGSGLGPGHARQFTKELHSAIRRVEGRRGRRLVDHLVEMAFEDKQVLMVVAKKILPDLKHSENKETRETNVTISWDAGGTPFAPNQLAAEEGAATGGLSFGGSPPPAITHDRDGTGRAPGDSPDHALSPNPDPSSLQKPATPSVMYQPSNQPPLSPPASMSREEFKERVAFASSSCEAMVLDAVFEEIDTSMHGENDDDNDSDNDEDVED